GLMTNCTPPVSNTVSSRVKLILEVVSGTLLMQTRIFIGSDLCTKDNHKLKINYACIVNIWDPALIFPGPKRVVSKALHGDGLLPRPRSGTIPGAGDLFGSRA